MPRSPVGTKTQPESGSAVAAHIAARLAGLGSGRAQRDAWLADNLGLKLRSNGLDRAAPRAREATRNWLLVDEERLPIEVHKTLVVFPGGGEARDDLSSRLRATRALRQLMVTRSRRDVIAVLLHRPQERDELFRRIESFGEAFVWEDIVAEDRSQEALAWSTIAIRLAGEESLGTGGLT